MAEVYRTKPDEAGDGDDHGSAEVHTVPGLMEQVKLARSIEKKRRERDKILSSIGKERDRSKKSGILAITAPTKILEANLVAKEKELEGEISKMLEIKKGES